MEITTPVWVAIVGAAASVIAAGFSFHSATRTARLKSQADLMLERFKAEDQNRRRAFELALKESEPLITALTQAWTDLQTIRDTIQKIVAPMRFDEAHALKTLRSAVTGISTGYSRFGSSLPREAEDAWHSAKGRVAIIETLVQQRGADAAPKRGCPPDIEERLTSIRSALRDDQTVLQQARDSVRAQVMRRIMEAM
jgi:hypothetical protein